MFLLSFCPICIFQTPKQVISRSIYRFAHGFNRIIAQLSFSHLHELHARFTLLVVTYLDYD